MMDNSFHYIRNYILCVRGLLKRNNIDDRTYPELFKNLNIEAERLLEDLKNLKE